MDRVTSMSVFVKTVDLGSLTAAATALGLSPQMVGKHVGFLEARLGAPLLRRTTRRQSLTDIGQAFYQRCRVILADMEAAEALVHDMSATPRGRLRVSAPVNFGACRLAPLVTRYLAAYPNVEVEVNLTDRYVDVVDEGIRRRNPARADQGYGAGGAGICRAIAKWPALRPPILRPVVRRPRPTTSSGTTASAT